MKLTKDEEIFIARTAQFMVENQHLTPEQAMRKVIERDQELWLMSTSNTEQGKAIRHDLAEDVYSRLRAR